MAGPVVPPLPALFVALFVVDVTMPQTKLYAAGGGEARAQSLGNRHGAVPPAGAPDCHRQV
jgi:hypothetical protein